MRVSRIEIIYQSIVVILILAKIKRFKITKNITDIFTSIILVAIHVLFITIYLLLLLNIFYDNTIYIFNRSFELFLLLV